ncbi:hypothetical protein B0H13DRAFT_2360512 [Mycena leptocephala]|nr:hypothetical protein B0H13DRAFT_2360512 [Mycena leptocephala]
MADVRFSGAAYPFAPQLSVTLARSSLPCPPLHHPMDSGLYIPQSILKGHVRESDRSWHASHVTILWAASWYQEPLRCSTSSLLVGLGSLSRSSPPRRTVPLPSHIFLPALLTFCALYPSLSRPFPSVRQRAWLLMGVGSFMTCAALPWEGSRNWGAYLTADMLIGFLHYRAQIGFLTGWVHHVVYVGITEIAIRWGHHRFDKLPHFFAREREIELSAGLAPSIMLTYYSATVYFVIDFVSVRYVPHMLSPILRGVPVKPCTVNGRAVNVPSVRGLEIQKTAVESTAVAVAATGGSPSAGILCVGNVSRACMRRVALRGPLCDAGGTRCSARPFPSRSSLPPLFFHLPPSPSSLLLASPLFRPRLPLTFCFCFQLPTFLLSLSTLFPCTCSNTLFAVTFIATQIVFHLVLVGEFLGIPPTAAARARLPLPTSIPTLRLTSPVSSNGLPFMQPLSVRRPPPARCPPPPRFPIQQKLAGGAHGCEGARRSLAARPRPPVPKRGEKWARPKAAASGAVSGSRHRRGGVTRSNLGHDVEAGGERGRIGVGGSMVGGVMRSNLGHDVEGARSLAACPACPVPKKAGNGPPQKRRRAGCIGVGGVDGGGGTRSNLRHDLEGAPARCAPRGQFQKGAK